MIFIQLSFNIILYNTILGTPVSSTIQGLKLRKYFRGQVGPYQINFGSPHNLLWVHQACIACLPPRLQGALRLRGGGGGGCSEALG